jgi:hypothetical protein
LEALEAHPEVEVAALDVARPFLADGVPLGRQQLAVGLPVAGVVARHAAAPQLLQQPPKPQALQRKLIQGLLLLQAIIT